MKRKFLLLSSALFLSHQAIAAEVDMNMAQMQAMDKITGRVSIIEVPVNGAVSFGTFSIVVRSCKARTEEEIPENFAFVDVTDKSFDKEEYNIFKGWMLSSSPAVNAVEHPIYDVWLLKCFNGEVKQELLLSEQQLLARDNLPRLNEVVEQTKTLNQNTFIADEPQNILIKDAMYKEEIKPEVQNALPEKIEGEPQNLLNIDESYEAEEVVNMSAEDFEKALEQEVQKLPVQETDIKILEMQVENAVDEELDTAINQELQNVE
ncbi:MAG: DUF2155 domain-containing protein [Alphaproteobacteria bacterium]|nr:DUF2155 domain-containing protein [Alphaproteobacteria bacterium]